MSAELCLAAVPSRPKETKAARSPQTDMFNEDHVTGILYWIGRERLGMLGMHVIDWMLAVIPKLCNGAENWAFLKHTKWFVHLYIPILSTRILQERGGGVFSPPSVFVDREKTMARCAAKLHIPVRPTIADIMKNFDPRSLQLRSPVQVKWPHLKKVLGCNTATVVERKFWNFQGIIQNIISAQDIRIYISSPKGHNSCM